MECGKDQFELIQEQMVTTLESVDHGKMMSCPAITFKGKVFAFYYKDMMVFKLGKEFPIEDYGVEDYGYLSPFKNKPPMKAWYEVKETDIDKWKTLAELAYGQMKDLIKT